MIRTRAQSLVCATLFVATTLPASGEPWRQQGPHPTGRDVEDVFLLSRDEVWLAGGIGEVFASVDGGVTYRSEQLEAFSVNGILFHDAMTGWAVGNGAWFTSDGGDSWQAASGLLGTAYTPFFVDTQHGWATAYSAVYRTDDGGRSWTLVETDTSSTMQGVFFHDPDRGWAVSIDGHVMGSLDGGRTWSLRHKAGDFSNTNTVWFADELEGWVIGGSTFLHTVDGGANWSEETVPAGTWAHRTFFLDRDRAWAVGEGGNIVATENGWETSVTQRPPGSDQRLRGVHFIDPEFGFAVGENGRVLVTGDGGGTWLQRNSGGAIVYALDAVDPAHAWAALESGMVARTTDGGAYWEDVLVDGFSSFGSVDDVDFWDRDIGWAAGLDQAFSGNQGVVSHTIDGGRTWTESYRGGTDEFIVAVAAVDDQTAVAAGYFPHLGGFLRRTADGGQTWQTVADGMGFPAALEFVSPLEGWFAGGLVYHTIDGGQTWDLAFTPDETIEDIAFGDLLHGWAVGRLGVMLRTVDGGRTWQDVPSPGAPFEDLDAVEAIDESTLWVMGSGETAWRSDDGGQTWSAETITTDTSASFSSLVFLDRDYGWAGGFPTVETGGPWLRRDGDPPGAALLHGRLLRGRVTTFEATGLPPDSDVRLVASRASGDGPCLPGAVCLDLAPPLRRLGTTVTDAAGAATFTFEVPATAPFIELHFQVVAIDSAGQVEKTHPTSGRIQP